MLYEDEPIHSNFKWMYVSIIFLYIYNTFQ